MTCEQAARLFDPYLDGELDLTTSIEVEDHLAGCSACRKALEERQELAQFVQEETPRYKASPFLATRIRASLREQTFATKKSSWWSLTPIPWIYSGLGGAFAVTALTILFSLSSASPELANEAIADHVRSLQANHLMDVASTDQHTVKPWFAGKIDFSPQVIDLSSAGYPLVGGRLDVLAQRNVAAIIYQRRKHYINLFVWPADKLGVKNFSYEKEGYHVFGWTKSGMNYLAVSELGEKELKEFTLKIQDQAVLPME